MVRLRAFSIGAAAHNAIPKAVDVAQSMQAGVTQNSAAIGVHFFRS
jgi:hypothetical protein